mgnify:CR=1 FL=1
MIDSLVPQLEVLLSFETLGIQSRFHLIRFENEHSTFSPSSSYESAIFLNEASFVVETNFHSLLHNLAYREQIRHYHRHVQDILDVIVLAIVAEWGASCRLLSL